MKTKVPQMAVKDALVRAREDLRQYAIAFCINTQHGNYFRCRVCNAESKEADTHILHAVGCSFTAINVALETLEAPSVEPQQPKSANASDNPET